MGVLTYIDTSMLVKRYVPEVGAQALEQRLLGELPTLIISELVRVELVSSLRRMERKGLIDRGFGSAALAYFMDDITQARVKVLPLNSMCLERAASLIAQLKSPLAALDGLHLATALIHHAVHFFTTDLQLSRAASEAGLVVWPEFD
jgi:predicted nucleic acid-binding protein